MLAIAVLGLAGIADDVTSDLARATIASVDVPSTSTAVRPRQLK